MVGHSRRKFLLYMAGMAVAACSTKTAERLALANTAIKIHPRKDWQAVAPDLNAVSEHGLFDPKTNPDGWLVYSSPLADVYNTLIIHHSALDLSYGPKKIQELHVQNKGYADIGYHFLVNERGGISEGRAINVRGAHTGGYNTGTIGVVLLGNFETGEPTSLQQQALSHLARYLADTYTLSHIAGHRDFQPGVTLCPGIHLEATLTDLAKSLDLQFGTGGYIAPAWANETTIH